MGIQVVYGDITTTTQHIIGHQVNRKGVMGRGVALTIRNKWPEVYTSYRNLCKYGITRMGDAYYITTEDKTHIIANLFGQDGYGLDEPHTCEVSLKYALTKLANDFHGDTFALPFKIGCINGGGNWDRIFDIIIEIFKDEDLILYQK